MEQISSLRPGVSRVCARDGRTNTTGRPLLRRRPAYKYLYYYFNLLLFRANLRQSYRFGFTCAEHYTRHVHTRWVLAHVDAVCFRG